MISTISSPRVGMILAAVLFAGVLLEGIPPSSGQGSSAQDSAVRPRPTEKSAKTKPCIAPEYRQFDFWIGDWDVVDADNPTTIVARARIDRILGGCVLHEDYQDTDGHKGQSFSIYDASANLWRQSWVTNRGEFLLIGGGFKDGAMVLSGSQRTDDGKEKQIRGVWKPMEGGVRETAVTSLDGGKSWKPWFDLLFRPHKL